MLVVRFAQILQMRVRTDFQYGGGRVTGIGS
jgi:hypothetical protein